MVDDEQSKQTRLATERLEILNAIVAAQERHNDVSAVVSDAPDKRAAIAAIADLLGVAETSARAISDLPWRRLAIDSREQMRAERDELLRYLTEERSQAAG